MTTVSLELNEVNFDFVKEYVKQGKLPSFKKALSSWCSIETKAEDHYPYLEPWIQWPSVYTGKNFAHHQIFRLGDAVHHDHVQLFEKIEGNTGRPVVAISPMNAVNRISEKSTFIPDPWTKTSVTGSWDCKVASEIVGRLVNENAHGLKLTIADAFKLSAAFLVNLHLPLIPLFARNLFLSFSYKWARPLVLDTMLASICHKKIAGSAPSYASLFLNAAAHIQHHYMFSSEAYSGNNKNPKWFYDGSLDPVLEVYKCYDDILGSFMRNDRATKIFIITALSQRPNPNVVHYYRPRKHRDLIERFLPETCDFTVTPRMSRDFLLEFKSAEEAELGAACLAKVRSDCGHSIFSCDIRDTSVFCQVVYFGPPDAGIQVTVSDGVVTIEKDFSHVTIENGIHQTIGYALRSDKSRAESEQDYPLENLHVDIVTACE